MEVPTNGTGVAGRRTGPRRGEMRDKQDEDRRVGERRGSFFRRRMVQFFRTHEMPKAADVVKTTKLIEPLITAISSVLSGVVNTAILGLAGFALVLALLPHEFGHYVATKKEGYKPKWFWFIPILGAIMRRAEVRSRLSAANIAFGGPLHGFIFSAIVTTLWLLVGPATVEVELIEVSKILYTVAVVSTILNLFNLIPVPPLDGGIMAQSMGGSWPKWMRPIGYLVLILLTWLWSGGRTTMLVVWILAIGEIRFEFGAYRLDKMWRFVIAVGLFLLMLALLGLQINAGALKGWNLLAEASYSSFAIWFIYIYYLQWKKPKLYKPSYEQRMRAVNHEEGGRVVRKYFGLLFLLFFVLCVLMFTPRHLS